MTAYLVAITLFFQGTDCRSCNLLAAAATALSTGDGAKFMTFLDKSTPGYNRIAANVGALSDQDDVAASLDVLTEKGDDDKLDVLVDWFMEISNKSDAGQTVRRRMRVHVTAQKFKGKWKITDIDPVAILDPVKVTL